MTSWAFGSDRPLTSAASSEPCTQWSGHSTWVPYGSLVVSNGFLPEWVEAKETCPGVCQSWVTTTFSNAAESLLITGTTSAPPLTGNVPPSTKQFCTSTT